MSPELNKKLSNKPVDLLPARRKELTTFGASQDKWHKIEAWHAGTRPLIAAHFAKHVEAFDKLIVIKWDDRRSLAQFAGKPDQRAEAEQTRKNNPLAIQARAAIIMYIDALIELCDVPELPASVLHESDAIFAEIHQMIGKSLLAPDFQRVVTADVKEAQNCYRGRSYKGFVVMLGAALEGVMLGTLQRADVLVACVAKPPKPIARLGTSDPELAKKICKDLGFDDYKTCIHELIPGSGDLGADNIQSFRNAIHPWKSIKEPLKFGNFDYTIALHYITAFKKIVEALYQWTP